MASSEQLRNAELLVRDERTDEDVERLSGVDLLQIIAIRARLAARLSTDRARGGRLGARTSPSGADAVGHDHA